MLHLATGAARRVSLDIIHAHDGPSQLVTGLNLGLIHHTITWTKASFCFVLTQRDSQWQTKRSTGWDIYRSWLSWIPWGVHINTKVSKWSYDLRSYESNFCNCVEKPEKFRTSTGFEPVTSRFRCDALTNWAMKPLTLGAGHLWVLMVPLKWYMKWIKPRWSPEFFRLLYAIAKIALITAKIIASLDFISAVHH